MALTTTKELRNQIIYCVFVRNHSDEGTFEAVRQDLPRIRALGTDIIWLMPVHPLGAVNRKGSLGSPYANMDYRGINPEYGTMDDFIRLTEDIHAQGMKVIIDVVYNHTSPDSVLAKEHPEWFYHKADGSFGNKVGEWWDVIDLDYSNSELWDYQIESLCMWAEYVDGFRCDVAPLISLDFWNKARQEVAAVRPGAVWLAESTEGGFVRYLRSRGIPAWTDAEIYQAFDIEYEYDIYQTYRAYLRGECALSDYCREINTQETIYPENYVKLRFLENHDRLRAHDLIRSEYSLRNWTAFMYFQKGTAFLYAGQEAGCTHLPSLFDRDPVNWNEPDAIDLTPFLQRLAGIKRSPVMTDSTYYVNAAPDDVAVAVHTANEWLPDERSERHGAALIGFFDLANGGTERPNIKSVTLRDMKTGDGRTLDRLLPDGEYPDLIDGRTITIIGGRLTGADFPLILSLSAGSK